MVKGTHIPDLAVRLTAGAHTFISGVLPKLGGRDEGPDPHELVEAGLAACTILTCQMYAQRKGWALVSTHVTVRVVSESKEASRIVREVSFEGDLTDEQRTRLLEIAEKCPVHNLLQSKITIETTTA